MALGLFNKLAGRQSKPRGTSNASRDRWLQVDGNSLPVRVVEHPGSRRITLRLLPGGDGLKVTMPAHVGDAELDAFLHRNVNWVAARRARLPKTVSIAEGQLIPFRGVPHRIMCSGPGRGVVEPLEINGEYVLRIPGDQAFIQRKLLDYFKKQARKVLAEHVVIHSASLDVRARQIRITDTTSRWGSCSSTRTLSFSWRIILAPPEVLDYLVAHEVAHLREMNHSPRFWQLVADICPQMERHKSWLRKNGAKLHAIQL
jgi:predicted metal-dependent hydrolase